MRNIWNQACSDHRWNLPSPFPDPKVRSGKTKHSERDAADIRDMVITEKDLKKTTDNEITDVRLPLRYYDWAAIYENLDEWSKPIAELMLLTGIIPSELAGLCPGHVRNGFIHIRQIITRGKLYDYPKEHDRIRDIRITKRIQSVLDRLLARKNDDSPFLISRKKATYLTHGAIGKAWTLAVKAAGINHCVPYCLRHTFAAWSLCLDIDKNRLVSLMGHCDKKMVYEVYGKYVEGLELDRAKILEMFGEDFITPEA